MIKYRYIIASIFLIIITIFIFIPRPIEKIYIAYDEKENDCNSKIIKQNLLNDSYLICDGFKFLNFVKIKDKKSKTLDLDKIDKFKIVSKKEFLNRFNNDKVSKEKYSFDLLDRNKLFEFNLITKDTFSDKINIIPVKQIRVLCKLKLID
ncbi:hypothetical protein MKD41_09290 [Lutibacter sp. A64]|uniref:hypothetical protein n=1 Tax=Lutibacter sp. A64 TaxID=2918526 RepID=UPI001F054950|nr:hypothetical protein [Lutibacter sp. A64]UMB52535.1 hypothetical protein MKD41_09290 [Lutibacter sp. A64]